MDLHNGGPWIIRFVHPVPKAHQSLLTSFYLFDKGRDVLVRTDFIQHVNDRFVSSTVARAVQGRRGACNRDKRVGVSRSDNSHRGCRTVLLVVSVQNQQGV